MASLLTLDTRENQKGALKSAREASRQNIQAQVKHKTALTDLRKGFSLTSN